MGLLHTQHGGLTVTRRRALRMSLGSLGALLAAACTPSSTTSPTAPSVAKVEPTTSSPASPAASANTATSQTPQTAPAKTGALQQVKVGSLPVLARAGFLIAQQRGFFADEGLDVEMVPFASGGDIVAPLGAGQIDAGAGITPSAGLVNAVARGVKLKIGVPGSTIIPNRNSGQIMVRKALAPAQGFLDLKTVPRPLRAAAVGEGTLPHAVALLQAEKEGVPLADVQVAFMGLPEMNAALKSGALDLAVSGEPFITQAVADGTAALWRPMADLYPRLPYSSVLFGPNLLEKDRAAGERLARGFLRGVRVYEDAFAKGKERDAVVGMLADPLRTPPALFTALQQNGGLSYTDPNGEVDIAPLKTIVDFWIRTNLIQPGFDVQVLVDPSFAEKAVAQLGRYT